MNYFMLGTEVLKCTRVEAWTQFCLEVHRPAGGALLNYLPSLFSGEHLKRGIKKEGGILMVKGKHDYCELVLRWTA